MTIYINGTTGISGVDGSAGTPAVQGTDTNTGVFYPAADTVGVSTGGSERMRVDSSGNVGIGYTSMSQKLQVNGNIALAASTGLLWDTNGSWQISSDDSTYIRFVTSGSEKMRIDSSGNLLVGTTSQFFSGKQCIYFDGNSLAGLSLQTSKATTGSTYVYFVNSASAGTGSISQNGTTTVAYGTSSDYRLKENIKPMTGSLATVAQLKPVTYKWKADGSDGQGFIAHELQEVVPDCVIGEKDAVDADGNPVYQGIDTSFLVATLTAAIQEQQTLITALTARIEALEAK